MRRYTQYSLLIMLFVIMGYGVRGLLTLPNPVEESNVLEIKAICLDGVEYWFNGINHGARQPYWVVLAPKYDSTTLKVSRCDEDEK
jgi:hypothetical protein